MWSIGITAIEMAESQPRKSRYPFVINYLFDNRFFSAPKVFA